MKDLFLNKIIWHPESELNTSVVCNPRSVGVFLGVNIVIWWESPDRCLYEIKGPHGIKIAYLSDFQSKEI